MYMMARYDTPEPVSPCTSAIVDSYLMETCLKVGPSKSLAHGLLGDSFVELAVLFL